MHFLTDATELFSFCVYSLFACIGVNANFCEFKIESRCNRQFHGCIPPKGRDAALESYVRAVRTDIQNHINKLQKVRFKDDLFPLRKSVVWQRQDV